MAPLDKRFLVYILGRGVPPPNNGTLRWCTRQIKVDPMKAEIARLGSESGKPWLVITGVRIGESAVRDARLVTACSRDGAECGQGHYQSALEGKNATLAPLVHWRVCLVWEWLRSWAPLHDYGGWNTVPLADAYGGDEAEEINARTGCTGCPLASRDTALEAVVAMPRWAYLAPLLELKALWRELREPRHRLRQPGGERRQDGTLCDNQHRMGPLTMAARMMALNRVLDIQHAVNEAARAQNRPLLDMLNHEEHVRILDLIAAGTWPRGWTGREPLATDPFDEAEGEADQRQARLFKDREDDTEGDTLGLEEV
jgi:DNA sulfur modification protein DndC